MSISFICPMGLFYFKSWRDDVCQIGCIRVSKMPNWCRGSCTRCCTGGSEMTKCCSCGSLHSNYVVWGGDFNWFLCRGNILICLYSGVILWSISKGRDKLAHLVWGIRVKCWPFLFPFTLPKYLGSIFIEFLRNVGLFTKHCFLAYSYYEMIFIDEFHENWTFFPT